MPTGDRIQMQLSSYAAGLAYERLDEQTVHAAKVRIIDTIGALVGGFAGEPCRIAREVAVQMPNPHGASVIGTNIRTSPDLAAFVNGTTARYVEMNDVYHWPGSAGGYPSDVLMPIFAATIVALTLGPVVKAANRRGISPWITALIIVVLCVGGLSLAATALAGPISEWIGRAPEIGARIGQKLSVLEQPFASLLQLEETLFGASAPAAAPSAPSVVLPVVAFVTPAAGMHGPNMSFAGKAGWSDHVARRPVMLQVFGGVGAPFKIHDTLIKPRASCATTATGRCYSIT